jgi:hypothetical protein
LAKEAVAWATGEIKPTDPGWENVDPAAPPSAPIYIVGAVDVREGRTLSRAWAFYHSAEEALGRMERDRLFFEDGHYTHGLIETYQPGSGQAAAEAWYQPVYPDENRHQPHTGVIPCDKPAGCVWICNFFLG